MASLGPSIEPPSSSSSLPLPHPPPSILSTAPPSLSLTPAPHPGLVASYSSPSIPHTGIPMHPTNSLDLPSSSRPYSSHGAILYGSSPYPPTANASTRTSFTRVEVDSLSMGAGTPGVGSVTSYPVLSGLGVGASAASALAGAPDGIESWAGGNELIIDNGQPAGAQGGATEQPQESEVPQTPQVSLTFLLVSGKRRTMSFDPDATVGRVKELVWNAWPADWQDERPPAPSYFRILYLGKILQDEDTLSHLQFPLTIPIQPCPGSPINPPQHSPMQDSPRSLSGNQAPTIVHLSIRSFAPQSDASIAKFKKSKLRRGLTSGTATSNVDEDRIEEQGAGCCSCVIC